MQPFTSARPLISHRLLGGLLIMVCLLFFSLQAQADTGILDGIAASYKNATSGWTTTMLNYANRLFMLLATIELAWSAAIWVLDKNEFQPLISAIAKKIMWLGMFYALLLNGQTWVPFIVDSFSEAGATASGSGGLSPSQVFSTGLDNAATMMLGALQMGFFEAIGAVVIVGIAAILVIVCFAIIAAQLLVALVESYIVISAGLLFLGFGGSRWTNDFVQKYIGYAVGAGVKLLMLYLIIGIGNKQAQEWNALLVADESFFHSVMTVLGGSLMLTFLAIQIPSLAGSLLSGSPILTGGSGITASGMIAGGVIGVGAKAIMGQRALSQAANADKNLPSGGQASGPSHALGTPGVASSTSSKAKPQTQAVNSALAPSYASALPASAGGFAGGGSGHQGPPPESGGQKSLFDKFLRSMRYTRPPQVHDGAMPATVHIKLDPPQD